MGFLVTAAILVAVSVVLVLLVRKNLEHRQKSRKLRELFVSEASDLVAKPEFPAVHAEFLIGMASIPQGWATRFYVTTLGKRLLSRKGNSRGTAPNIEQVPKQLRKKYVVAILAFALSDSYRCVIFGRIFRATHSWLGEALREPKPDVDAHATRAVIEQVSNASAHKRTYASREPVVA